MKVSQLMSEPAVTCRASDSLLLAADLMRTRRVDAVVVISDEGRARTVITERDICIAAANARQALDRVRVAAIEGSGEALLVCSPDDSIEAAQTIMQVNGARRLVVADPTARPLGLISIDDLAVEALRELERGDAEPAIAPVALVTTLGEIARAETPSRGGP